VSEQISAFFSSVLKISRIALEDRREAYREVRDGSWPRRRFYVLVALSAIIAGYGLLSGSVAVIIGAMLVAPLMGPIFGIALSLVSGDVKLLRASLTAEIFGVFLAVLFGYLIGIMPYNLGITSEMLSRTTPTVFDLAIAVASGLAGAYATVQPRLNAALPGVAISVALIPPLTTGGMLIAMGKWDLAWGAIMLFLANFFAIQLASAFIFIIYDMGSIYQAVKVGPAGLIVRFIPSAIAVVAIGFFMFNTLRIIFEERVFQADLKSVLQSEISSRTGGQLEGIASQKQTEVGYEVVAVALTPSPFEPSQVEKIEKMLRETVRPDIYLIIRSLQSKDNSAVGQVFQAPEDIELMRLSERKSQMLSTARSTVESLLEGVPGAKLEGLYSTGIENEPRFTANISTPDAITPEMVGQIEDAIQDKLGRNVRLIVRSIIVRDADKHRYIYDPVPEDAPELSQEEIDFQTLLWDEISEGLEEFAGAALIDIKLTRIKGEMIPPNVDEIVRDPDSEDGEQSESDTFNVTEQIMVLAEVRTPFPIAPEDVSILEQRLRERVADNIVLSMNLTLGGTATAQGWQRYSPALSGIGTTTP